MELRFFVLDYHLLELEFINDAVKLLKFCNAKVLNSFNVKVRILAFGM